MAFMVTLEISRETALMLFNSAPDFDQLGPEGKELYLALESVLDDE